MTARCPNVAELNVRAIAHDVARFRAHVHTDPDDAIVQVDVEALGGGGSRSSAAVQLHDVSVAQAVQMARKSIDDNLEN